MPLFTYEAGTSSSAVSALSWAGEYFKPDWATIAPGKTVTSFKYEPLPASGRNADLFPTPIPIDQELDLDWLDVDAEMTNDEMTK